jgi:hypothetical protein
MGRVTDKQLFVFWEKHVLGKKLYRIVAGKYLPDIRRQGLNPRKNPFEREKKDLQRFGAILLDLRKKGFVMMRWWGKPVDQTRVMATTFQDLDSNYVDFTPKMRVDYYLALRGGALAQTIHIYSEELLMKRPPLAANEWALVKKLNAWSKKLCQDKNALLSIRASSAYLEHAEFQHFTGPNIDSPFGSFEHFKRVVEKNGLELYKPYLEGEKLFYLRSTKPIPSSELRFER